MRLAAIYNIFDGTEFLIPSFASVKDHVDVFILVYQKISNYGEAIDPNDLDRVDLTPVLFKDSHIVEYIPNQNNGTWNETNKRNLGIQKAKDLGCTHFIQMDCDEIYEDFGKMKQEYVNSGADGSVCAMLTYFKHQTLRFEEPDNYFVPFIHKLHANTVTGSKNYPFRVDPTRSINSQNVVLISGFMHHFSWVRRDISKKIRNSSAQKNIAKSNLLSDYMNPDIKEGSLVVDFRQKLVKVPDIFDLNRIFH